jgi:hypothetical protein
MKPSSIVAVVILFGALATVSCNKQQEPLREAASHKDAYREAYVYGFPMLMNYGVMYEYAID